MQIQDSALCVVAKKSTIAHTHLHTDTDIYRHRDTQRHRDTHAQTDRQTNRQTDRHTHTHTHIHTHTHTHTNTHTQTHTHKHTHTHTAIHTHTKKIYLMVLAFIGHGFELDPLAGTTVLQTCIHLQLQPRSYSFWYRAYSNFHVYRPTLSNGSFWYFRGWGVGVRTFHLKGLLTAATFFNAFLDASVACISNNTKYLSTNR